MIAPIFYILLIVLLVALPAIAGWKLSRRHGQSIRIAGTIFAGQLILTPGMAFLSFSNGGVAGESPFRTVMIYASMAIVISIMTFAILEIKNTRKEK